MQIIVTTIFGLSMLSTMLLWRKLFNEFKRNNRHST
jgi:hypothetical protein